MSTIKKTEGNASGRFFTTDCCIGCDACAVLAPKNFAALPDGRYVVIKQPGTPAELQAVLEAYQLTFGPNGPGPCIIDLEDKENFPAGLES